MPPKKAKPSLDNAVSLWPSNNPHDSANHDPLHKVSLFDYGFNHLNIAVPEPMPYTDPPALPVAPTFKAPADEQRYLQTIASKLSLTKDFILKGNDLGLDSSLRMDKNATATLLAKGPITFNLYTQEIVRDLVNLRVKILDLGQNEAENDVALQQLAHEYLWVWRELKGVLVSLVPRARDEIMEKRAEDIMVEVLGESLVEV
ncbi:hypothetical protein BDU57DRAFT_536850 [Ampelomyces quisqualis]|uniref:Uncharacterized protein n=1 Tax=Ampelomyces quisqualis TaxID=50730 RepID=A0A6A5QZ19_AMPQU|nr:hypothetical protein BDU57DRAFT_536850 [Ampelomyces quisqualis]